MRIPIKALKEIAKKYSLSHIILFAYHPNSKEHHIASYGKSLEGCSQAADFSNTLREALGWPEALLVQPSRVKKLQVEVEGLKELLKQVAQHVSTDNIGAGSALVCDTLQKLMRDNYFYEQK